MTGEKLTLESDLEVEIVSDADAESAEARRLLWSIPLTLVLLGVGMPLVLRAVSWLVAWLGLAA